MARRPPVLLLGILALAAGLGGCRTGLPATLQGGSASGGGSKNFDAYDLEGTWRGWSEPFNPFDKRLELTLTFDAYGPGSQAVSLTEYTFPSPVDGRTVDYLSLLDGYELQFLPSGRLSLDTEYRSWEWFGTNVEELVFKDLRMDASGDRLEGGETIEVYENGRLTIYYEGWLTLERVR